MVFSSGINAWLPFSFDLFRFSISLLSLLLFLSCSPILPRSWLLGFFRFPSRFHGFLPIILPNFLSTFFGSQYSAFCLFPFVLPCFAPTAVSQVLTFSVFRLPLGVFPCVSLSFVRFPFRFRLLSLLILSLSLPPGFSSQRSFRCVFCLSTSAYP